MIREARKRKLEKMEEKYPGYLHYCIMRRFSEIPGDILDSAEEFEDREAAKDIWYPDFIKSIEKYLSSK
jgi:hypothetical protein